MKSFLKKDLTNSTMTINFFLIKTLIFCIFQFLPFETLSGYFENEEKVPVKDCLKFFEKGKLINKYVNKYSISKTVIRSDEYYEFSYLGNYYNLFFGYKIYDNNFKYINGSECVTINFDRKYKMEKSLETK